MLPLGLIPKICFSYGIQEHHSGWLHSEVIFIDYVEADIAVKYVTKINRVGIGTTLHKFKNGKGKDVFLPCVFYHIPTVDVWLFSSKTYHQRHGVNSYICVYCVEMNSKDHIIVIPIRRELANLKLCTTTLYLLKIRSKLDHTSGQQWPTLI